jgi:hypothetical protein
VSLDNRAVHAGSEAKIIRIDDQTPHAASLAGRLSDDGASVGNYSSNG